ncbi:class I SAM-dependent methyltransferase [Halobaculum sp. MBLA0143]|uniref:class I SAM-dependent methyltransferase n=1 Tax=Halobaculum sp. MBLA0143 TaxID=3079933 RepID=UPI003524CFCE
MNSDEVRRGWADRSGAYSPAYYAYHGPDARSEWVTRAVETRLGETGSVLEVGCSSGRHLEQFRRAGFDDLAGVELNPEAVSVMGEAFPELATVADVRVDGMASALADRPTDDVDVVYAVETLQHVPPASTEAFEEIARVAGELVVTAENEGDGDHSDGSPGEVTHVDDDLPLFFRDWGRVFEAQGLDLVETAATVDGRTTGRVFRV